VNTSSRKAKGRVLQNEIRDMLRNLALSRGMPVGEQDIEGREMGQKGVDVRMSPAIRKVFNLCIECKNVEKLNVVTTFIKHFKMYCEKDPTSLKLLFHRKNRVEPLVTLRAEDFFKIYADHLKMKDQEILGHHGSSGLPGIIDR
jgi:hypothetical protein